MRQQGRDVHPLGIWFRSIAFASVFFCSSIVTAQSSTSPQPDIVAQVIQRLPADWRSTAAQYRVFPSTGDNSYLLKQSDDDLRYLVLSRLEADPGAEHFVAAHLDEQIAAAANTKARTRLIDGLAYNDNWTNNSLTVPLLEREAVGNPDPEVAAEAVSGLHALEAKRALVVLNKRLRGVSWDYKNNKDEVDGLEAAQQGLLYTEDGVDLPDFMQMPPPVFEVPTKTSSIRVAMMGDFGTRGEDQHKVAAAMVGEGKKKPFDFGITLGDNFYFDLKSPDDTGFKDAFEDLYGPMKITFYPCFGNHDWGGELPEIEILYSNENPHWRFPAPYYTYTAGPVQFFVINTEFGSDGEQHLFSALQARWLQTELDKSTAKWRVVYGHMPPYTSMWTSYTLAGELMPVLKGRADVYISGHVHNLEQHKAEDGVNLFIIGASGRGGVPVDPSDPDTIFAKEAYGFGVLEANDHTLTIRILGEDGKELHEATFHK